MGTLMDSPQPCVPGPHVAGTSRRGICEVEAPDKGEQLREAPESPPGRLAEAPDAGEGRMQFSENEFTHGRSQS